MKKIIALVLVCMLTLAGAAFAETLKMGTNANFPPYEYYDDATGEIVGIDVEIADAVCKKLGYDGVEVVDMEFSAIINAVVSGKVDVVNLCLAMPYTDEVDAPGVFVP